MFADCPLSIAHALTDSVRKYGPVVSFRQGSQVIIVIGSVEVNCTCFSFFPEIDPFVRQPRKSWKRKVHHW